MSRLAKKRSTNKYELMQYETGIMYFGCTDPATPNVATHKLAHFLNTSIRGNLYFIVSDIFRVIHKNNIYLYIFYTMGKGNGGIMGSGVFGFFGTTIKCDSTDKSMYCQIMKLFNLLIVFFVVSIILYYAYYFAIKPLLLKSKR